MGNLIRKIAGAFQARKFQTSKSTPIYDESKDKGIFCDCYGTLYCHNFSHDELLVRFLNAKHREGIPVTLISSKISDVAPHISDIGLNPAIVASLTSKMRYYSSTLEILIDDDPAPIEARTLYHPADPIFRGQIQAFLENNNNPAPAPG
ncbi:MAG TPA: hypothetical protein VFS88_02220 [Micavibrio sp.]|nr:hypothetical protein [Micavibrio sp.]